MACAPADRSSMRSHTWGYTPATPVAREGGEPSLAKRMLESLEKTAASADTQAGAARAAVRSPADEAVKLGRIPVSCPGVVRSVYDRSAADVPVYTTTLEVQGSDSAVDTDEWRTTSCIVVH